MRSCQTDLLRPSCLSRMSPVRLSRTCFLSSLRKKLGGCGSFYAITIASTAFKGLPIVKQHRLVNDVLKEEIKGIHGLQVLPPLKS
jgi:stress-induced morphogen